KVALSILTSDMEIHDQSLSADCYEFPMIGSVQLDLVQDLLSADLNAVIDGGQAAFKSQTTKLATPQPQTRFRLNTEKLDLNRWLPAPTAAAEAKPGAPAQESDKEADQAQDKDKKQGP